MSACASYQSRKQAQLLSIPELGTIAKTKGDLLYFAASQIGTPAWEALSVTARELPFNKAKYAAYQDRVLQGRELGGIVYSDTLSVKPKFLRLQLSDKIILTEILNNEANRGLRDYLEHDSDYKMITTLDLALPEAEIQVFVRAKAIQLQKDEFGGIALMVFGPEGKKQYSFSELPVFDYDYVSFCWGQDRYHRRIIENLADRSERCPSGTFMNPKKLEKDAAYTQF